MASSLRLPFAHLNLRFNPFGEPTFSDWAELALVDLPELRPGDPVQFIGESGRGKTTHLLALQRQHPGTVYQRLHEGIDRCSLPSSGLFLLDEAQWLRPRLLRGLVNGPTAVAFGTHDDLSPAAGRPLRTVRVDVIDAARLRAIIDRRIEWARRGSGRVPAVRDDTLCALIERHGSDVRAIIGNLYAAFQRMEEPGDVEV
jgi:hypothetical protein